MQTKMPTGWQIFFKQNDLESVKMSILNNLEYRLAKDHYSASAYDRFLAAAYTVTERLIEKWIVTQQAYHRQKPKRVYYLSMEFLLGRSLDNSLINLRLRKVFQQALEELGIDLSELIDEEMEAGLGNGGLGRLAACFLDSMATLGIPAHGYGIRYDYGLFKQRIEHDRQVELPDNWLAVPHPWEIARPEYRFKVLFGGRVECIRGPLGKERTVVVGGDEVIAMPYDIPIPGYNTDNVNTLRLWAANSTDEFNLSSFNTGDYLAASKEMLESELITKVLYPNDMFRSGKELRLKQEYFLVSASIQDIVRRFKEDYNNWSILPDKVAIQLNDTHPALAIPELMRILIDVEGLDWDAAWKITVPTFAYTNHTVLPEALEEWPVEMLERLLPRHMEIIYNINYNFLQEVSARFPGDTDRLRRVSLINEDNGRGVRMAHLAVVGSHTVNGVSKLHTRLLKETVLRDLAQLMPSKLMNETNGITPRRWLRQANPPLSELITEAIGDRWITDLAHLRALEGYADDKSFQESWRTVKQRCKTPIVELLRNDRQLLLSPESLFDVQVKRFHEYKRQLLFALYIIAEYLHVKEGVHPDFIPRVCLVGGKAAPGYDMAKLIIHFINRVADTINRDPAVGDRLRLAFLPNYSVSLAEKLIPAANLSEQISTAGKEASGTSNMKFALNGALTIGTLDGANVEIKEEVGDENIFIFGMNADEVQQCKREGYHPAQIIAASPILQQILHLIQCDFFSPGEPGLFRPLFDMLTNYDEYCLIADFAAYYECQQQVSAAYRDTARWTRMSILNVARCGKFSSDHTINGYARDIWNAAPVIVRPSEVSTPNGRVAVAEL